MTSVSAGRARQRAKPAAAPASEPGCGLRTDAERNRQRILTSAQQLFTAQGLDVPLEEIARHAGVGIATLYRRFPTRGDLITATFERKIADYTAAVARALDHPDPWAGFCQLVYDLCGLQAADAGLKELLTMSFPDSPVIQDMLAQGERDLGTLIGRTQVQGQLRADFDPTDMLMLLQANAGLVTATHRTAPDAWRRFAAYMIEAFHTPGRTSAPALPAAPPQDQLRRSLTSLSLP